MKICKSKYETLPVIFLIILLCDKHRISLSVSKMNRLLYIIVRLYKRAFGIDLIPVSPIYIDGKFIYPNITRFLDKLISLDTNEEGEGRGGESLNFSLEGLFEEPNSITSISTEDVSFIETIVLQYGIKTVEDLTNKIEL